MDSTYKKNTIIYLFSVMIFSVTLLTSMPSYSGWLIYHKPSFEGKIVDANSGEPVRGAVIAVIYYKRYYTPISSDNEPIYVRQTITDRDGAFRFPSYTTIISPFCTVDRVTFSIFKADYASISNQNLANIFTGKQPEEDRRVYAWRGKQYLVLRFSPGVVALPKLTKKEDMIASASYVSLSYIPSGSLLENAVHDAQRRNNQ